MNRLFLLFISASLSIAAAEGDQEAFKRIFEKPHRTEMGILLAGSVAFVGQYQTIAGLFRVRPIRGVVGLATLAVGASAMLIVDDSNHRTICSMLEKNEQTQEPFKKFLAALKNNRVVRNAVYRFDDIVDTAEVELNKRSDQK